MCRNASWFCLPHYQVYNSGRLPLLLSAWPSETTKQNQTKGDLQEPSSGAGDTAASAIRKTIFSPPPWLLFWSLSLICFPLHNAPAWQTQFTQFTWQREVFYPEMTEEVINLFRKRSGAYTAMCGHAGLHPALRTIAPGQGRPQRRQRERRSDSETDLWISAVFDRR